MYVQSDLQSEDYTSFFTGIYDNDSYRKNPVLSLFPFNMKSVNCTHNDRKIKIVSVELKQNLTFCEKQNLHESFTECIRLKVNASCNGKQICDQLTFNGCDDCSRLSKFAYISFSCKGMSRFMLVFCILVNSNYFYQVLSLLPIQLLLSLFGAFCQSI